MRYRVLLLLCTTLLALLSSVSAMAGAVRISQVYSGGMHDAWFDSPYAADFVELFNAGGTPADVGGWLLAYGGSNPTSLFGCAGCTLTLPQGSTIPPCGYFLVQVSPESHNYGTHLPAPDATLLLPSDLTSCGAIALMSSGAPSGDCLYGLPGVQDDVGWCAGCNQALGGITSPNALLRKEGGMVFTGLAYPDFVLGTPTPRTSESPQNPLCLLTPALPTSWGRIKVLFR